MKANIYEVNIVLMDDKCNDSTHINDVATCTTFQLAKDYAKKIEKELTQGKWNKQMYRAKFAYVSAIPYDEEWNYLGGLCPDYNSRFYRREGDKWVAHTI